MSYPHHCLSLPPPRSGESAVMALLHIKLTAAANCHLPRSVAPICSPTRSALLTGRYPIRTRGQHGVIEGNGPDTWVSNHGEPFVGSFKEYRRGFVSISWSFSGMTARMFGADPRGRGAAAGAAAGARLRDAGQVRHTVTLDVVAASSH